MLKTLAIGSFLLGAVIAGCAAAYYFITVDSLELERVETENRLDGLQQSLETIESIHKGLGEIDQSFGVLSGPQKSEGEKKYFEAVSATTSEIKTKKKKLQQVNHRLRSAKRGSLIGGAIGLFFCLIQAPFLLVVGKQG